MSPVPVLFSLETVQGALEQAAEHVLELRIEGPCTKGYGLIRIHN